MLVELDAPPPSPYTPIISPGGGWRPIDPRKARVIELHYFGGLTYDETARALEISPGHRGPGPSHGSGVAVPGVESRGTHPLRLTRFPRASAVMRESAPPVCRFSQRGCVSHPFQNPRKPGPGEPHDTP